jgi:DNA-binding sugar fermentation-stimulating protein
MAVLQQANFLMPDDLLEELRRTVPKGQQSKVVAQALERELRRIRFLKNLDKQFGAWTKEPHPELEAGVERYVRVLRRSTRGKRS